VDIKQKAPATKPALLFLSGEFVVSRADSNRGNNELKFPALPFWLAAPIVVWLLLPIGRKMSGRQM
jgi:hypothetical protein